MFVGQAIPYEIGPPTVAVPGIPAGVLHLWRRWGRLPWAEVVAPGRAASLGSVFPSTHADLLPKVSPAFHVSDGIEVYSRPDGSTLQAGDLVAHPAHPEAYDLLATDPEAFYRGEYARAVLEVLGDTSAMEAADLEAYRVIESKPRRVGVHGFGVLARGDDLDDVLGTMQAAAAGMTGDPLTSPAAARALVQALRAPDRRSETTNLVAADAEGNVCAVTTSLGLGSGVWVPDFGVHLNSMLGEGELVRERRRPRDADGLDDVADAGDRPERSSGGGGRGGGWQPDPLGAGAVHAPDARAHPSPGRDRCSPPERRTGGGAAGTRLLRGGGAGAGRSRRRGRGRRDARPYFGGVSALSWLGGGADPRRSGHVELHLAADLPDAPPPRPAETAVSLRW